MISAVKRSVNAFLRALLTLALVASSLPAQQEEDYTFHAESELVLVNVTVRDRSGNLVKGLKPEDFTILEDNKPQKIISFDIENIDAVANQNVAQAKALQGLSAPQSASPPPATSETQLTDQFKDRRLIILFFDLSAMEPDEIDHAVTSAERYVATQMAPADLVAIVSLGSSLLVNQDFTSDHDLLTKQIHAFNAGSGRDSKKAQPARLRERPTPGSHSLLMTPNTTSSIPTAGWRRCDRWRKSFRTCSRRNR